MKSKQQMRLLPRPLLPILLVLLLSSSTLYLTLKISNLVSLFYTHSGVALTQDEILDVHTTFFRTDDHLEGDGKGKVGNSRLELGNVGVEDEQHGRELIPRIIHQIWHNWKDPGNETLPRDWEEVRGSCLRWNEGWEYHLWTESKSLEFIQTHYPWFLRTYQGYIYPVQRTDALRYFLMYHYGGIYLDLDNGCLRDLTPLLSYPFWTTDGGRGALSNNILASVPSHPFFHLMITSLPAYGYNFLFPYVTISMASGQWYETDIWERYHRGLSESPSLSSSSASSPPSNPSSPTIHRPHSPKHTNTSTSETSLQQRLRLLLDQRHGLRIMMDDRPGTPPWIFFTQERGGSWVNWDNAMWLWLGDHLMLEGIVLLCSLTLIGWSVRRCCCHCGSRGRGRAGGRGRGRYKRTISAGGDDRWWKRDDEERGADVKRGRSGSGDGEGEIEVGRRRD